MVGILASTRAERGQAASTPVAVFPSPGSRVAPPGAQIAFRGLPAGAIGAISVIGSQSGTHLGRIEADSDGNGGSFIPDRPFKPGEVVTVHTGLDVLGATGGTFGFTVATPAGAVTTMPRMATQRFPGDVQRFHSAPGLAPVAVKLLKRSSRAAGGDIFVAPQAGPVQVGPMILGADGSLVWFNPLTAKSASASDFRVQSYLGRPVLTWWQGALGAGIGVGEGIIYDTSYRRVAIVRAADGLSADLHEFTISPHDTALITVYHPVYWDVSSMSGPKRKVVLDSVVQEIDIRTGLLLFQWDSLDHVPVTSSYFRSPKGPYDYFHVNSVQQTPDGNLLISGRNTYAGYLVDHRTGAVIWQLGGKHSSYRMGPGASFAMQHDMRLRSGGIVTLFDNGAGPPIVHKQSRAIALRLDTTHMTATVASQVLHAPSLLANFEGNDQLLANGDSFVGWGQQPYFTEFNAKDQVVFDARFVDAQSGYRAYRFSWSGTPATRPSVAASVRGGATTVYASWNGATRVASWRVLAGTSTRSLRAIRTARKRGFETVIVISGAARYAAVQALDGTGRTLATSATVRAR